MLGYATLPLASESGVMRLGFQNERRRVLLDLFDVHARLRRVPCLPLRENNQPAAKRGLFPVRSVRRIDVGDVLRNCVQTGSAAPAIRSHRYLIFRTYFTVQRATSPFLILPQRSKRAGSPLYAHYNFSFSAISIVEYCRRSSSTTKLCVKAFFALSVINCSIDRLFPS